MDPVEFDQSEQGWRSLVGKTNEEDIANLILKYIKLNSHKVEEYNKGKPADKTFPIGLLHFHAGQSFGYAGIKYYPDAIRCFKVSYSNKNECWNAYVDGTIAFLKGDINEVKKQIKIIEGSMLKNKKGGNINILKNFSKCLDLGVVDYSKAYEM